MGEDGSMDGQMGSSGTHPHSLTGAKGSMHSSAGTAASTCVCVQALQVRSPSKPKLVHACLAWAHSPQGMGWGVREGETSLRMGRYFGADNSLLKGTAAYTTAQL